MLKVIFLQCKIYYITTFFISSLYSNKQTQRSVASLKANVIPSSDSYTDLSSYSIILNRPFSKKLKSIRKLSLQSDISKISQSTMNTLSKHKQSVNEYNEEKENMLDLSDLSNFNLEDEEEDSLSFNSSFDEVETTSIDEDNLLRFESNQ